jgi:hypothetical protein
MILFFDNFITNKIIGTHYKNLDAIRKTNAKYKKIFVPIHCIAIQKLNLNVL